MVEFNDVQQRWDNFLLKIEERFHEVLKQTEAVLPTLLDYQNFDTTPFGNAWQGIEAQVKDLISKIDDTWQNKVSESFDEIINSSDNFYAENHVEYYRDIYYPALEKGRKLAHKLQKELKRYEVNTFAEAGRKLQKKADEILGSNFSCTQCKAPLPVKQNFFRSYYQTCDYCQTVNTFEPGTIARNVEHFALHPIAEATCLDEYFVYCDLEDAYKQQNDDEPKAINKDVVVNAYKTYAEKYLKARIAVIPDLQSEYEKDLEGKVGHVERWLK
jgi:hypothetical protein